MSEKWWLLRWKERAGNIPPGSPFWLKGIEYARFGFEARMVHTNIGFASAWVWETGELARVDDEAIVFYNDTGGSDWWRLAAYLQTRAGVNGRISRAYNQAFQSRVPPSLVDTHRWIASCVDDDAPVKWRTWIRFVLSSPRMNLRPSGYQEPYD